VDPVPDSLLLRNSGSAGNRTRDLCIFSQELWPLEHTGGLIPPYGFIYVIYCYVYPQDVNLTTHLHLEPRSRNVDLNLHT
jgi:hypothetical protein